MLSKGYRILLYGLILVAVAGSLRFLQEQVTLRRPLSPGTEISVSTVYALCNHEVKSRAELPQKKEMSLLDLRQVYPPRQGWRSKFIGNTLIFTRTDEELCPACRKKTHLGEKGGYVAVMRGPAGINGGIVKVTNIKIISLPPELQERVRAGDLDLPDEEALLQILDSLDEGAGNS
ncbi:MAG: hypothetical protein QHH75_09245 [Bacillota bacterium]|jgi:hypothetical protein|nr:hypothetical protein [Bacillota bacterium]